MSTQPVTPAVRESKNESEPKAASITMTTEDNGKTFPFDREQVGSLIFPLIDWSKTTTRHSDKRNYDYQTTLQTSWNMEDEQGNRIQFTFCANKFPKTELKDGLGGKGVPAVKGYPLTNVDSAYVESEINKAKAAKDFDRYERFMAYKAAHASGGLSLSQLVHLKEDMEQSVANHPDAPKPQQKAS